MNGFSGVSLASLRAALLSLALLVAISPSGPAASAEENLTGRLLIAVPDLTDPNFSGTVIYLVRHGANGALGLVVNEPMGEVPLHRLLGTKGPDGEQPRDGADGFKLPVHYGGPVEPRQAFILHSPDVLPESSVKIDEQIAFSRDRDLLYAVEKGKGPERLMVLLGYSGWAPGQLEAEIERQSWYLAEWDESLVFGSDHAAKWQRAITLYAPEL